VPALRGKYLLLGASACSLSNEKGKKAERKKKTNN
jgi:hypothetical protein